jgi:hypothetical protein
MKRASWWNYNEERLTLGSDEIVKLVATGLLVFLAKMRLHVNHVIFTAEIFTFISTWGVMGRT